MKNQIRRDRNSVVEYESEIRDLDENDFFKIKFQFHLCTIALGKEIGHYFYEISRILDQIDGSENKNNLKEILISIGDEENNKVGGKFKKVLDKILKIYERENNLDGWVPFKNLSNIIEENTLEKVNDEYVEGSHLIDACKAFSKVLYQNFFPSQNISEVDKNLQKQCLNLYKTQNEKKLPNEEFQKILSEFYYNKIFPRLQII